ncbi:hypothetical protein G6F59_018233 [Rhizopus arrhizus]|nr:hypothetical protein G6F59_018233 [Rhizopus arrhizus]
MVLRRQVAPLHGRQPFATEFGQARAGNRSQQIALPDLLAQVGRHAFDHARHARHDVGGAVGVELDFARERRGPGQRGWRGNGHLDARHRDLFGR